MPLPEDEAQWQTLDVMFATTRGTVRRNKLSDFADVRRSGIIAMRLDDGEAIVDVQICSEKDDVLLTTAAGQCIRFSGGRSACVPGPHVDGRARHRAGEGDKVISLSILQHMEATPDERAAYLNAIAPMRCVASGGAALEAEIEAKPKLRKPPAL